MEVKRHEIICGYKHSKTTTSKQSIESSYADNQYHVENDVARISKPIFQAAEDATSSEPNADDVNPAKESMKNHQGTLSENVNSRVDSKLEDHSLLGTQEKADWIKEKIGWN